MAILTDRKAGRFGFWTQLRFAATPQSFLGDAVPRALLAAKVASWAAAIDVVNKAKAPRCPIVLGLNALSLKHKWYSIGLFWWRRASFLGGCPLFLVLRRKEGGRKEGGGGRKDLNRKWTWNQPQIAIKPKLDINPKHPEFKLGEIWSQPCPNLKTSNRFWVNPKPTLNRFQNQPWINHKPSLP